MTSHASSHALPFAAAARLAFPRSTYTVGPVWSGALEFHGAQRCDLSRVPASGSAHGSSPRAASQSRDGSNSQGPSARDATELGSRSTTPVSYTHLTLPTKRIV